MKSEDKLQAECFQWFWNTFPDLRRTLFAVPNGGSRNIREAMKFKATGLIAGVHDLIWLYKGKFISFELKVGRNKISNDQMKFQQAIENQGGKCYEIRDFETFEKIVLKYVA